MKKNNITLPFIIVCTVSLLSILISSCIGEQGKSDSEKEPSASYVDLKSDTIPFISEISDESKFFIRTNDSVTYFCDIVYPSTTAHLYCTFRFADGDKMEQLWDEAYRLAGNHLVTSSYIDEQAVSNTFGVRGVVFDMGGKAATPYQIALTDGVTFFFNASLYFDDGSHGDDVPDLVDRMKKDIDRFILNFHLNVD